MKNCNRILIVLEDTGRGGAETQALILCKGLVEKGFDVHILSFGIKQGTYWDYFSKTGAKMYLTGFKSKLVLSPFYNFKLLLINLRYSFKLIKLIRTINPYIIFPFTYPPNSIIARCFRYTKAKAFYWNQRDAGMMFKGQEWEIKAMNSATEIISNSMEGALFLKKYTNREIKIIHNGVVLPEKKSKYFSDEKIKLIMVANLHSFKDHLTLLKAWKLIIESSNNSNIELLLAGKDGDMANEIRKYIIKNKLHDSVQCLGEVAEVPSLLATCDIGVFSSVKEGLPNGILECMAVGLPVVATKMHGSIEALGEDYPFLVEPYDEDTFAHMILELIEDADLRKRIGLQNLIRIKENFGVEKMVNQFISLINL